MGYGVKVPMHLDAWGEFVFSFLQNYTVKIFETKYSNGQSDCEQESTERSSKPTKQRIL